MSKANDAAELWMIESSKKNMEIVLFRFVAATGVVLTAMVGFFEYLGGRVVMPWKPFP
jgi:hypothetical protein